MENDSKPEPKKRIKTYIDGFDDRLGGGIVEGSIVLVAGNAGTMKTSVAYNILYHNVKKVGMKAAYLSLEQDRESLIYHTEGLGLPYDDDISKNLLVLDLSGTRLEVEDFGLRESWTYIIKDIVTKTHERLGLDLLVLDSLNVYETMCGGSKDIRIELFEFFKWIKGLGITCFVISEMSRDSNEFSRHGGDFLADGILHLTLEKVDDVHSHRRIRCVKMRSSNHSTDYFALIFGSSNFRIPIGISDVWK